MTKVQHIAAAVWQRGAVVAAALLLAACGLVPPRVPDSPAERVQVFLTGSFSSAAQARTDSRYLAIEMHAVRIWPERKDGTWLYVEQALAGQGIKPYRQRIERLAQRGNFWVLQDFLLPGNAADYAGAWRRPARFAALRHSELQWRVGCDVTLRLQADGNFSGATQGQACKSTLLGAAYETREMSLSASGIALWERGYDANGHPVWGPAQGPYRFERSN